LFITKKSLIFQIDSEMTPSTSDRYIAVIKWFHDHTRDAPYGFIAHPAMEDLFFHIKDIKKGQEPWSY